MLFIFARVAGEHIVLLLAVLVVSVNHPLIGPTTGGEGNG
jgi:hypothetical protein